MGGIRTPSAAVTAEDIEKKIRMKNNNIINGNSWITYFDILGFKGKISDFERDFGHGRLDLFKQNFYGELIEALTKLEEYQPDKVFITWFSDTFFFFTRDDSNDSFTHMSGAAQCFFQVAMSKSWPLRGAIGFGQLYADKANNIFLGSGLIDAYECAEKQNWIGLAVTPEAKRRLGELGIDLKRRPIRFKEYDVPMKRKKVEYGTYDFVEETEPLFAVRIQKLPNVIRYVKQMQDTTSGRDPQGYRERYRVIYENTLKFVES